MGRERGVGEELAAMKRNGKRHLEVVLIEVWWVAALSW
jgi:hypothetical protein